jgi:hypothetical protein
VSANAWHRQPPKSIALRSQLRHGSAIHASPRNASSAGELAQICASGRSVTRSNASGSDVAA